MSVVSDESLNLLFREARTHSDWRDEPVEVALLELVYGLAKMGPYVGRHVSHAHRVCAVGLDCGPMSGFDNAKGGPGLLRGDKRQVELSVQPRPRR
jgi:hypothetical protein